MLSGIIKVLGDNYHERQKNRSWSTGSSLH